jgi:hypothetical protein
MKADGRIDIVRIDKEVDWDNPSAVEKLVFAVEEPDYPRLIEEVKAYPSLARLKWDVGDTILLYAGDQPKLAQLLVRLGADVNAHDPTGFGTPLHQAAYYGNVQVAQFLPRVPARRGGDHLADPVTVRPGATKDLGDLKVKAGSR